ncbi:MAG: hypothetical protein KDC85_18260 [Saprospiraceae bacterium]|nr:hypothetical protein [Saprospiraceae bacterium]MCB9325879.1 hypothetical protein [Lewinellaceae bacterium]
MADKNLLDKLKGFKEHFNPQSAMVGMAANMLPGLEKQFVEKLEGMERPESEGGKLPEGWDKIAYSVVAINGQLNLSVHALKRDENGTMTMSAPFSSFPLSELLNAK